MSERFLMYCKMTCVGGSEQGQCPCKHPNACEIQDDLDYAQAREDAKDRMWRHLEETVVKLTEFSSSLKQELYRVLEDTFSRKPK